MGPAKKKSAAASDAAVTEKKVRENFFCLDKKSRTVKKQFCGTSEDSVRKGTSRTWPTLVEN